MMTKVGRISRQLGSGFAPGALLALAMTVAACGGSKDADADVTGTWMGSLTVNGLPLRVVVNLTAEGTGTLDVPAAQESAESLVTANRLYRASAIQAGDTGVASVLEELERVLVEVAHQGPGASAKEMERIRRRIEERGILFKVRVIESQVRERGNDGRPAPAIHTKVSS